MPLSVNPVAVMYTFVTKDSMQNDTISILKGFDSSIRSCVYQTVFTMKVVLNFIGMYNL